MSGCEPCKTYLRSRKHDVKVWCVKELGHEGKHEMVSGFQWPDRVEK